MDKLVCNTLSEVKTSTGNLDKAKLCPIQIDDGGVIKKAENFRAVYNISQGKMCTAVVPHYTLVQHKEYFDTFAESLNRLGIKYKMTLSQAGNRAFADIEFEGRNLKYEKLNEEFTTGIRLINSYDKSTGIFVIPRFTRLACTNGMIVTRSEKSVSIKHHMKEIRQLDAFVEKKVNEVISRYADLQEWVSSSIKDSAEWRTCCGIVAKLFEQIKHREAILKNLGISIVEITDKKDKKKKTITYVLDKKDGQKKFTRWELYNAITRYLSHGEQITPHIEDLFHRRAEKLLDTPLEKMPKIEVKL